MKMKFDLLNNTNTSDTMENDVGTQNNQKRRYSYASSASSLFKDDKSELWIFGYGSLMWYPGFEYELSRRGSALGYKRRFYQGNTTYRGTQEMPGRVVTLIESQCKSDQACGLLFKVTGWSVIFRALEHLYMREIENGYSFRIVSVLDFHTQTTVQALTCIATEKNAFYLGPCPVSKGGFESEAKQIASAQGCGGPNKDYLLKLAECMRRMFPEHQDEHLFELETAVLALVSS